MRQTQFFRKLLHMLLALGFAYLGVSVPVWVTLSLVACVGVVFFMLRHVLFARMVRTAESRSFGEYFLIAGIAATALVFGQAHEAYLAGMLVLGFADTTASVIGRTWGVRPYRVFGETRTYTGSFTALVVSAFVFVALGVSYPLAFLSGWFLAVIEALSPRGSDNFFLPIIAAALYGAMVGP